MSSLFVVERGGVKPEFKIEQLKRGSRSNEVATFDLAILVRGKIAAQIFGAKLIEGRESQFVTGPSFAGPDDKWISTVSVGRDLQEGLIRQLQQLLEELRHDN